MNILSLPPSLPPVVDYLPFLPIGDCPAGVLNRFVPDTLNSVSEAVSIVGGLPIGGSIQSLAFVSNYHTLQCIVISITVYISMFRNLYACTYIHMYM